MDGAAGGPVEHGRGLQELPGGRRLTEFLARSGWVVDLSEQRRHPQRYVELTLPAWLGCNPWRLAA